MVQDHNLNKDDTVILDIAKENQTLTPFSRKEHSLIEMRHIGGILPVSTGIKQ